MSAPHYAKDVYGLLPMEQMLDYSGLDFMKGILNGDLPAPPIAQTLNFRLKEVVDGKVVFTGAPQDSKASFPPPRPNPTYTQTKP